MNLTDQEINVLDAGRDFARAARRFSMVPRDAADYEAAIQSVVDLGNALQLAARRLLDPGAFATFATHIDAPTEPPPPEPSTLPILPRLDDGEEETT